MSVNYDRVCRLCLSSRGELLPIFSATSEEGMEPSVLASKIKDCVSVEVNENDELPTCVCRKCSDNVNNWHIFKNVCERSQNKLQSLLKKDGNQLEEVKVKSEPLTDEAYDDGVVIDGSYPESEQNSTSSNKIQPEGPPILASLGLTPRSDKGVESDKDDEGEEEEDEEEMEEEDEGQQPSHVVPHMPEVSITVVSRKGIQQLASKNCLVCGRTYRYSHNARRHELSAHSFDRYTNKVTPKNTNINNTIMQPKLRPNPFNPKARLMPNPNNHKMQFLPKPILPLSASVKMQPNRIITKPIQIKPAQKGPNQLPYPLRIRALKDLQIRKKEPQILKTLLTTKPEVLVSEPEILNSGPESPETLISEPEIASFQVEAILSEPDVYDQQGDEVDDQNQNHNSYNTVDMESDNEIEMAQQEDPMSETDKQADHLTENNGDDSQYDNSEEQAEGNAEDYAGVETKEGENKVIENGEGENDYQDGNPEENDEDMDDDEDMPPMAPVVEINEDVLNNSVDNSAKIDEEEEADETLENEGTEAVEELDPNKVYVTKSQKEFISKYRNVIEQINTKRCLCCDKEYPRRKAVIQHLQKNGQKVPKHTCYNCVVTFTHLGALLSHMRADVCTNLWKVIYNEEGITEDMVIEDEPKDVKQPHKDLFNARSYACKLCPMKFQLKQFITKHVVDVHESGQTKVPLGCIHCGSRFKDKGLWKKHVRNGECTVCIACDLCPEKFANVQAFNNHILAVHVGTVEAENYSKTIDGRPTDCPLCDKKMGSYQNLVKHLRIYHNEEKPHYCQNCDEKFEKTDDLNNHIYMEHTDRSAMTVKSEVDTSIVKEEAEEYHYSCTECNAIFETVDAWTDHQVAEHNQVAHHCDQCEKKFLRPSELAEHKNTHLRVKLYRCNLCSDSYSTPQKLSDHVQQVHAGAGGFANNDNEFYCEICVRQFKSRQAYSNHMRIHAKVPTTNRKPGDTSKTFSPQIIGKPIKALHAMNATNNLPFTTNLNVPNAPYSCDICGKGFMHKKNIWKHKKILHSDLVDDRNDSEENTMQGSTEDDEYNVDENGAVLSTPQFDSFNFSSYTSPAPQPVLPKIITPPAPTSFSCDLCYKKFPLKTNLWKHKRSKHGIINASTVGPPETQSQQAYSSSAGEGGRSCCTICNISFSDKKSYYRHRKNVHKSTSQACKICGIPLNSTLELYEHLRAAHSRELLGFDANQGSNKPHENHEEAEYEADQETADPSAEYQARYPCDTCGKQFVGLLALQNHQCINQTSSQPPSFDCEICHKSYYSIAALKSHRGWHLRSPDGKAAANNSGLWMPQHKVTSKHSKSEIVDAIQLAKVTHSTPVAVAKRRLPPEVEVTVVNPNKKMRSDESELDHSGSIEDRYCNICDKEFTKRAAYQRHMDEVHMPNSVFCPVCDKSFTRKSTLLVHMKKHYEGGEGSSTGVVQEEIGFGCEICGVSCPSSVALSIHKAKEHAEDSGESEDEGIPNDPPPPGEFTCGQCGDGVATPRALIAHRTMHATPSKFYCSVCKVYFSRSSELATHMRSRHSEAGEKSFYPCAMCDRFYMNKKSLQKHIEMAH